MTELIKEWLSNLSYTVNRSLAQTIELYELCDGNLDNLLSLEERIKNNHISYCPSSRKEVEQVLALQNKDVWFSLNEFRIVKSKSHNTCIMFRNEEGTKFDCKAVPSGDNRTDYYWRTSNYCSPDKVKYEYNVIDTKETQERYKGVKIRIENGNRVLPLNVYDNLK